MGISEANSDLAITKLSHCVGPASGGTRVMIFTDKVTKEDIEIRFFEEKNGQIYWEAKADFLPADVHHQVINIKLY